MLFNFAKVMLYEEKCGIISFFERKFENNIWYY